MSSSTRVTRAAKVLAQQILEHWEDAQITNGTEPDGLNVIRTLVVAEPVGAPLGDVLVAILPHDRRIQDLDLDPETGDLTIEFAPTRHADDSTPFPIAEVLRVQGAAEAPKNGAQGDEGSPEAPKSTKGAKKAAAPKKPEGPDVVVEAEDVVEEVQS